MRSVPQAMTWEILHYRPWNLLIGAAGANLLPVTILTALQYDGAISPSDPSMIVMHVVLAQMQMFAFAVAAFSSQGSPARLYTRPMATSAIVTWHMLPAMLIAAVGSLLSTMFLNFMYQLDWPLGGPTLFVAVAVAAVQAILWLTEKSAWMVAGMALVTGVLGIWFKSRYGMPFAQPQHYWLQVGPSEVATMLGIAIVSYGTGIAAIARNRRGEPPVSLGIIDWLSSIPDLIPDFGRSYRTPLQAHYWFEWRQKGWMMPIATLCATVIGGCAWLLFSRDPEELMGGLIVGGGMLSALGMVGGLLIGNMGPQENNDAIGPFLATRPLTTPEMARTILKVASHSVLITWSAWAAAFLSVYFSLRAIGHHFAIEDWFSQGWWYLPATLVSVWLVVTLGATISLSGRSAICAKFLVFCLLAVIALLLLSTFGLSELQRAQLWRGAAIAGGVVCLLITIGSFLIANRWRLIAWRTVASAISVWGALAALVVIVWLPYSRESPGLGVLLFGLSALAVAPLATAPLALTWNRNR